MTTQKEKSKAEAWLERYGWRKGKGLGKNEDGIRNFIKVTKKDDTTGLGASSDTVRDFGWWDSLYMSSLKQIQVVSSKEETKICCQKKECKKVESYLNGLFVRAENGSSTSTRETNSQMNDEQLFKLCEERQLRSKGNGKMARIREQDYAYSRHKRKHESDELNSDERHLQDRKSVV